jgi:RimJ/RimL family protein N-acetyltransferase
MPTIKTKKFILRPLKMSDKESLAKHVNYRAIARNLLVIPYPYKLKDAKFWISKVLKYNKMKKPTDIIFGIEINGNVVGSIGIHRIKEKHKAEIGYWLGKEYWGKGIMSEAVKIISEYCFNKLKLRRIVAKVFLFNEPSKRVLEKNGFKMEGILRKEENKKGKLLDTYLMARVR